MQNKVLLATSAVMAFFCAGQAAAQDRWTGWQATLGASSVESTMDGDGVFSPMPVEPSGVMVDIGLNHRWRVGHIVLGVHGSAQLGSVEASASQISCTVADCGFEEVQYSSERMDYTVSLGGSIGHEIGPVLVSVSADVTLGDYTHTVLFDSNGVYPKYEYEQKGFRAGVRFGLAAEYAFTDQWSGRIEISQTELVEQKVENTYDSYDAGLSVTTITAGMGWKF